MRDLLARGSGIPESVLRPPPKTKKMTWGRSLLLVLSGMAVASISIVWILWYGRDTHLLSFERATRVASDPSTADYPRMSAWLKLMVLGKQGLAAIRQLERRGGEYQARARTALARLDSLMNQRSLLRTGPRPVGLEFDTAIDELIRPRGSPTKTWTSLEVVVYGLEDAIQSMSRYATKGGELGGFATICLSKLRGFLESR